MWLQLWAFPQTPWTFSYLCAFTHPVSTAGNAFPLPPVKLLLIFQNPAQTSLPSHEQAAPFPRVLPWPLVHTSITALKAIYVFKCFSLDLGTSREASVTL